MTQKSGEWMTAREVADLLGVSAETVRRYIRLGHLPANHLPSGHVRIRRADARTLLPKNEDAEER